MLTQPKGPPAIAAKSSHKGLSRSDGGVEYDNNA